MKSILFVLLIVAAATEPRQAEIQYFSNVREVRIAQADRQNYVVVDEEIWNHSRADLGDIRLYAGTSQVPYGLSEQRAGTSSEEVEAKILNLGRVAGHTEFDLDIEGIAEFDRIRLRLDAQDFVVKASVSGRNALDQDSATELVSTTLYDFTHERLGSNSILKLQPSSFHYLHVRLSPPILPKQVKGAAVFNLRETQASWTSAGSCAAPLQQQRTTVITCGVNPRVPLSRVLFQVDSSQANFHRGVTVEDAHGVQLANGAISRVRLNRFGTAVTSEDLAISVPARDSSHLVIMVDNADNTPLAFTTVQPVALERRIYFDPHGNNQLQLYYGDEKLSPPAYDYARFFHLDDSSVEAKLGPGKHNAAYTGRPDDRPWSERHTVILWATMLLAVTVLAALAIRGLKSGSNP